MIKINKIQLEYLTNLKLKILGKIRISWSHIIFKSLVNYYL